MLKHVAGDQTTLGAFSTSGPVGECATDCEADLHVCYEVPSRGVVC